MQSVAKTSKKMPDTHRRTLRVGAVAYLNSKPLISGLAQSLAKFGELSLDLPSQLADDLATASIDIGLIPVVEYFRHPDFRIVSDAAIACRGPVWSVRVFFRCEPSQVRTLALDEGSRTSAALCKILFHQRFGFIPKTIPLRMTDDPIAAAADAVLVIGDRAMHPQEFKPAFESDWDLGQIWLEETGLPFVFALWVARRDEFATIELRGILEATRDAGVREISSIAAAASKSYRLTTDQCEDYLTNYIRFHLRTEEQVGLDEFRRRCLALGLIPTE